MRHVEEVMRKIEELENTTSNNDYFDYDQSYAEYCAVAQDRAYLNMLKYIIDNGFLIENKIFELKSEVENGLKSPLASSSTENEFKGYLNALNWVSENSKVKDVLLRENDFYHEQIKKYSKKINKLQSKIVDNNCVLNSLKG